ncbi:MBL fold metallo-hydrolase [Alkalihalobacillus pseudalcaliphilus]|uniref:MBL fold metallo-hydrolase n=1 Tax=Alkalihalobacillus pseudalcaliphilus TaxID=79884 RepID=UPI002361960E|nr:ribonuclease Z [Alkalihalobacillus pseudalcaliphilus]
MICLGTGYAAAAANRDNTYLLLREQVNRDAGTVLIDVGGSPLTKLKKEQVDLKAIRAVIFTHFHIDHIYGMPSLLWGMWLAGREEELTICCGSGDEKKLRHWLELLEMDSWPAKFQIKIHVYKAEEKAELLTLGEAKVSTFPAKHAVPTVGIEVREGNRTLVYSSDTEPNEWIRQYDYIDELYHECTLARGALVHHTSLQQFSQFYNLHVFGKIVFVHLSDQEDYVSAMNEFMSEEEKARIHFAEEKA